MTYYDNAGTRHVVGFTSISDLELDASGSAYFTNPSGVWKVSPGGSASLASIAGTSGLAIDTAGNIWTTVTDSSTTPAINSLRKYQPDGTLLGSYTLPFQGACVHFDGAGHFWVTDLTKGATQLVRVDADGTVGAPISITANDLCLDASSHVWYVNDSSLVELGEDGSTIASYSDPGFAIAWGDGAIWLGTATGQVEEIKP